ncbi:hypothetical protein ABI_34390 [Asticcacaulis biprosthecium C19]|uniref:STAS/SEC14 domain-containing protein n=1 Tax=Asticcacaulis biprosthecium C19 TaxID=715226 RepID=F4QQD1_9CAUL|nr:STAS/SEC14 domain-containing protein [Asticcacaulis biprosthecium]EGF90418.1 hypothetical protein ABI_34390 [Asticcacaulis biprosthecium C19]
MARRFHVRAQIDEDRHRILFVISGDIESRALIDHWIEVYSEIAEPWTYDRLFDYRRAEGLVDFDEITRLAAWWHDRVGCRDYSSRVAVVVNNPLDQARIHVVSRLFPREIRKAFTTVDEALEWLDGTAARRRA